jgi:hypothetical protein
MVICRIITIFPAHILANSVKQSRSVPCVSPRATSLRIHKLLLYVRLYGVKLSSLSTTCCGMWQGSPVPMQDASLLGQTRLPPRLPRVSLSYFSPMTFSLLPIGARLLRPHPTLFSRGEALREGGLISSQGAAPLTTKRRRPRRLGRDFSVCRVQNGCGRREKGGELPRWEQNKESSHLILRATCLLSRLHMILERTCQKGTCNQVLPPSPV